MGDVVPLLRTIVYDRRNRIDWHASIEASLAASRRINVRLGRLSRRLTPGLAACYRCETSWAFVQGHQTRYRDDGHACFPLCEKCWSELSIEARMPFYRALYEVWLVQARRLPYEDRIREVHRLMEDWPAIKRAVAAGR